MKNNLIEDTNGIVFSVEVLIGILILVILIGIIANITDSSNEKIFNSIENNYLEKISAETVDYLIKNPGSPENWQKLSNFNNIIPGLAIKKKNSETLINTVSFEKFNVLKDNYHQLIDNNLFKNEIHSSIAIYPINSKINPILLGNNDNNSLITNIYVSNRTVKCDFLSDYVLINLKNFNDENNLYNSNTCEHVLNKTVDENYIYICKSFKIKDSNLDYGSYYLLFEEENKNNENFWEISSPDILSNNYMTINSNEICLNDVLIEKLKNKNERILYLHFKIKKENKDEFSSVLVHIPNDLEIDDIIIDYFKEQDCYLILKTWYA